MSRVVSLSLIQWIIVNCRSIYTLLGISLIEDSRTYFCIEMDRIVLVLIVNPHPTLNHITLEVNL